MGRDADDMLLRAVVKMRQRKDLVEGESHMGQGDVHAVPVKLGTLATGARGSQLSFGAQSAKVPRSTSAYAGRHWESSTGEVGVAKAEGWRHPKQ